MKHTECDAGLGHDSGRGLWAGHGYGRGNDCALVEVRLTFECSFEGIALGLETSVVEVDTVCHLLKSELPSYT